MGEVLVCVQLSRIFYLSRIGFEGETLGDRLQKVSPVIIPNLEDVFAAHKTRNDIVHDPDYRLTLQDAKTAIKAYEDAFSALDLI